MRDGMLQCQSEPVRGWSEGRAVLMRRYCTFTGKVQALCRQPLQQGVAGLRDALPP